MITLRRLDLIRQLSPALADELSNVQTQINAQPSLKTQIHATAGALAGYVEIEFRGATYVMPIYEKG